MKLELKKVSYSERLSEETSAYAAQIWADGVHICDVFNHGTGGPDEHVPAKGKTNADIAKLDEAIRAERGTEKVHGYEIDVDLEIVCGELLTDYLIGKELKRLLNRTVAYIDPKTNKVMSFKGKHEGVARAHLCTETLRRHPGAKILNNLPFDEALALYRKEA